MSKRRSQARGPLASAVATTMAKRAVAQVEVTPDGPPEFSMELPQVSGTHHGTCGTCGHEQFTENPRSTECPACGSNTVYWYHSPQPLTAA